MSRAGKKLEYGSQLESDSYLVLDFDPSVSGIATRPQEVGGYVASCSVETTETRYIIDVKYENQLVERWEELAPSFLQVDNYCTQHGMVYGFITDTSISKLGDRLALLKQVIGIGRGKVDNAIENQVLAILKDEAPLAVKSAVEKWNAHLDYSSKVIAICRLAVAGLVVILKTPTQDIGDCVIALASQRVQACFPSCIVPYGQFLSRLETHPNRKFGQGPITYLDNGKIAISEKVYEIIDDKCAEDAVLKSLETGEVYRHINLRNAVSSDNSLQDSDSHDAAFLLDLQRQYPALYEKFQQRHNAILPLLRLRNRTERDIQEAAENVGKSARQIRRWLVAYEKNGAGGLCREHMRGPRGLCRVNRTAETIAKQIIEEEYLTKQRKRASEIYMLFQAECYARGIRCPSQRYIYRLIQRISPRLITARRFGQKAYDEKYGLQGGEFRDKDYPLHTVQIDHEQLDIRVRDELTGLVVARPWLTIAIDVYSRCVWGYHLGLRQPDDDIVGLALVMGSLRKDRYVEMFGLSEWPVFGLPHQVHTDNGKDFRSDLLDTGCAAHRISVKRRPVKKPRYGAYVERIFETIKTKLIENLPGKTFANIAERKQGDYDSDKEALLTIKDLERQLLKFIVDEYHNTIHSEIGTSPLEKWKTGLREGLFAPREPEDPERFRIDFLSFPEPDGMRTIQKDGVHFKDLVYYAPALDLLSRENNKVPKKYYIRYDPLDLHYIYILDDRNSTYHALLIKNCPDQHFTLRELEKAREVAQKRGNRQPSEAIILESILRRRELLKNLVVSNKKARKVVAAHNRDQEIHGRFVKSGTRSRQREPVKEYEPVYREDLASEIRLPLGADEVTADG